MKNKVKAQDILLIFMVGLFVLQIAISHEELSNAITDSNIAKVMMFGIPIIVVLGALVSMIKRRLKLNKEKE